MIWVSNFLSTPTPLLRCCFSCRSAGLCYLFLTSGLTPSFLFAEVEWFFESQLLATVDFESHIGDLFDLSSKMGIGFRTVQGAVLFWLTFQLCGFGCILRILNLGLTVYELRLFLFVFEEVLVFEDFEFCSFSAFAPIN